MKRDAFGRRQIEEGVNRTKSTYGFMSMTGARAGSRCSHGPRRCRAARSSGWRWRGCCSTRPPTPSWTSAPPLCLPMARCDCRGDAIPFDQVQRCTVVCSGGCADRRNSELPLVLILSVCRVCSQQSAPHRHAPTACRGVRPWILFSARRAEACPRPLWPLQAMSLEVDSYAGKQRCRRGWFMRGFCARAADGRCG